ncbi:MAG: aspartate kinase [archaeon]|nr:aspartate kinase [archaeon]
MELLVAKFGGTSVGNGKRIRQAAQSVVDEYMKGKKVVVVVSAINKTTDELTTITEDAMGDEAAARARAEILSMGERTSIRVMSSVIESLGVKSEYIDPEHELWPVLTDNIPLGAEINFEESEAKAQGLFKLLDDGVIPVICGFLGKDENGNITTLGRGGSDITAFFLGHALKAKEVIIVTDVDGVMSTDPRKIADAIKLDQISVEEMRDLATHGAQVLHPHALKYKDPNIGAKIISFEKECLADEGTAIVGPYEDSTNDLVDLHPEPITAVAMVGEDLLNNVGLIAKITAVIAEVGVNIYGISAGQNSITTFLNKADAEVVYPLLHDVVIEEDCLSSISLGGDIGMLTMVSPDFIDTPGIISIITSPLKDNDINIIEISSSQTSVVLYVEWKDSRKAYDLIKEVL